MLWAVGRVNSVFIESCHCKSAHQVMYGLHDDVLTKLNIFFSSDLTYELTVKSSDSSGKEYMAFFLMSMFCLLIFFQCLYFLFYSPDLFICEVNVRSSFPRSHRKSVKEPGTAPGTADSTRQFPACYMGTQDTNFRGRRVRLFLKLS